MSEFLFRTNCPMCFDNTTFCWTHANCGGSFYINEYAYLTCHKCWERYFVLFGNFNCDKCSKDYARHLEFNYSKKYVYSLIDIISNVENFPTMLPHIRKQIREKLAEYI